MLSKLAKHLYTLSKALHDAKELGTNKWEWRLDVFFCWGKDGQNKTVFNKNILKGHGHDVSAYLREYLNSVGGVKSTCTLYAARLEYQKVDFKID